MDRRKAPLPIKTDLLLFNSILTGLDSSDSQTPTEHVSSKVEQLLAATLTDAELAAVALFIVRSDPTQSHKGRSWIETMQPDTRLIKPRIRRMDEDVPEGEYNGLEFIDRRPWLIAAIKAYFPLSEEIRDPESRLAQARERIQQQGGQEVLAEVNELGSICLVRAQDVVTSIDLDGRELRLLKPAPESTKEEILEQVVSLFDADSGQSNRQATFHWYGAEAVYDAVSETGAVCESVAHLSVRVPDRSFLYCYYFGIENVPKEYAATAQLFRQTWEDCQSAAMMGDLSLLERLRGWLPDKGMPDKNDPAYIKQPGKLAIQDVNGGLMGDSLFIERHLVTAVAHNSGEAVDAGDVGYPAAMQRAVSIVRGEAIAFNQTARTLLEILRRKLLKIPIPESIKDDEFRLIAEKLNAYVKEARLYDGTIFGGKWYNISSESLQELHDTASLDDFLWVLVTDRVESTALLQ